MCTAGASQGLNFLSTHFFKKGDVVFVEDPTYFLALASFRYDLELNVIAGKGTQIHSFLGGSVKWLIIIIITTVLIKRITLPLHLYALERKIMKNVRREKRKRGLHQILSIVIFLEKKGFQKWLKIIDRVSLFQVKWNSVPQQWPTKRKSMFPIKPSALNWAF